MHFVLTMILPVDTDPWIIPHRRILSIADTSVDGCMQPFHSFFICIQEEIRLKVFLVDAVGICIR